MSLRQKTIKGLLWSAFSQGGKQISQFVITVMLARLLSPNDFGLLAMATVFTGFAMIFGELGISSALVQKQDVEEKHWSSAFWLNLSVGFCLTGLFIIIAPLVAAFYEKHELTAIFQVLSLNFIFSSFSIIQQTVLTREMNFRSLMIRDILAVIVSGSIGVVMAVRGWGIWSLVGQSLSFNIINGILLWGMSSWRPKLIFSRQAISDIFNFSANMTIFQVINYLSRNIDQLLVGRFLGAEALGYYSLAYKLMLLPVQNLAWVVNRVMFPAFSRIQNDINKMREIYLTMIKGIAMISFPAMACLGFLAAYIIEFLYGKDWKMVADLLEIFAICGALQSIAVVIGNIYQARGRADIQLKYSLFFNLPSVILAVFIALPYGLKGITIGLTVRTLIANYVGQAICNKLIGLKWADYWKVQFNGILLTLITFTVLLVWHTVSVMLWEGIASQVTLFSSVLLFCVSYIIAVHIIVPEFSLKKLFNKGSV